MRSVAIIIGSDSLGPVGVVVMSVRRLGVPGILRHLAVSLNIRRRACDIADFTGPFGQDGWPKRPETTRAI